MAGDWLKIEKVTPDKPEVEEIADALELDPDAVFGKLVRVWAWFDDHTEAGNAPRVTTKQIDRRVRCEGFAQAMIDVGWLKEGVKDSGTDLTLPNFDRHNGETSKKRALTAKRVAKHKAKGNAEGNAKVNAEVTQEALPVVTQSALPREEKSLREEASASSLADAAAPRRRQVGEAVCAVFGLNPSSPGDHARLGKLARDLDAKLGNLAPAEWAGALRLRVAAHRKVYPGISVVTPESVEKHWDQLTTSAAPVRTRAQVDAENAEHQRRHEERCAAERAGRLDPAEMRQLAAEAKALLFGAAKAPEAPCEGADEKAGAA